MALNNYLKVAFTKRLKWNNGFYIINVKFKARIIILNDRVQDQYTQNMPNLNIYTFTLLFYIAFKDKLNGLRLTDSMNPGLVVLSVTT